MIGCRSRSRRVGARRRVPSRAPHRAHRRADDDAGRPSSAPAAMPDAAPHRRQVARGDDRVRRQPVDLGLVEQQEERAVAADAVVGVVAVQPRLARRPASCSCSTRPAGALAQLVELAELDRVGRARLRAGRLLADLEPVIAERALEDRARRPRACRARRRGRPARSSRSRCRCPAWTTTVPNSVRKIAPVGQTSRQAACVQCLQTSEAISQRKSSPSRWKLGSWPPSGARCSMNATWRQVSALSPPVLSCEIAGPVQPVLGHPVPLLARDLARLAADAHRGVGEEAHPRRMLLVAGGGGRIAAAAAGRRAGPSKLAHGAIPVCCGDAGALAGSRDERLARRSARAAARAGCRRSAP